jgi:hypothetical protein
MNHEMIFWVRIERPPIKLSSRRKSRLGTADVRTRNPGEPMQTNHEYLQTIGSATMPPDPQNLQEQLFARSVTFPSDQNPQSDST